MLSLNQYIIEARGVVRGEADWTDMCQWIAKAVPNMYRQSTISGKTVDMFGQSIEYKTVKVPQNKLTNWMHSCNVNILDLGKHQYGYVETENMQYVGEKPVVVIFLNERMMRSRRKIEQILQHEIQHLYDNYVSKDRIQQTKGSYCVGCGGGFDGSLNEIYYENNFNWEVILTLLQQYTYFCHDIELSAFLRNVDVTCKHKKLLTKIPNDLDDLTELDGFAPLIIAKLIKYVYKNVDKIDDYWSILTTLDYERQGNKSWLDICKIKSFKNEKNPEIRLKNILGYIIDKYLNRLTKRYKRVIDDNGKEYDDDLFE